MSKTGQSLSFKYNDSGIRTQKTVNGVTTKYTLNGDKVTLEDNGTDKIYYSYDAAGNLVSMNLNGTEYYYIRNAQGDIIGLFDSAGTQVVGYTYDSWGKLISTTGTLASTVGVKNPYLYRGYRSDKETGLYYLQSRYYSPDWGRFINADALGGKVGELLSHNVFAYCENNPITRQDPDGHYWQIVGAVVGAVGGAVGGAVIAGALTDWDWRYMLAGAAAGALVGVRLGYAAEATYGAIAAGAGAVTVATNALPNYQKAVFETKKLTDYALSPTHPNGQNKAKVFKSALGYTQSNAEQLKSAVIRQLPYAEAKLGEMTQHGQKYVVDMFIKGSNGNAASVRTAWIIKNGTDFPQLITIFVNKGR